ncbi:hypothetical protein F4775DRAFT_604620 [Biscogniauxia sp. FL1348]|nr:hypothetical protein F4775DRAFT_604620 [Biscogniauxia sp. FL1348]
MSSSSSTTTTNTLPTPEALLTSLFDAISSIPLPIPIPIHSPSPNTTTTTTAPPSSSSTTHKPQAPTPFPPSPSLLPSLSLIPPSHRPLLTTLHAIYPTTLLPALDILDRGLLSRISISISASTPIPPTTPTPSPVFHIVRSTTSLPRRHPHRGAPTCRGGKGKHYIVRLRSWNCTCAAFAYAAFPSIPLPLSTSTSTSTPTSHHHRTHAVRPGGTAYIFGGSLPEDPTPTPFSTTTTNNEDNNSKHVLPPCCKHILACVLAERWAWLRGYVEERVVSPEEGAGLVADDDV